jgi:hypothetical protein
MNSFVCLTEPPNCGSLPGEHAENGFVENRLRVLPPHQIGNAPSAFKRFRE